MSLCFLKVVSWFFFFLNFLPYLYFKGNSKQNIDNKKRMKQK